MTVTLKDMLTARADAAPGPRVDVDAIVGRGRRRVWRNRVVGATAACAALVAAALVVPALPLGSSDDSGIAGTGGFEERRLTYAEGSTIHYGNREIDVSPHELRSFIQTDDGFVFADADDTVYFTNGAEIAEIGHAGAFTQFFADDTGSYVGWVEIDEGDRPETVVYDTSAGAEVLRTSAGNGPGPGYLSDYDMPRIEGLDGDVAYVRNADGVVAIELSTGDASTVIPPRSHDMLHDVANGQLARGGNASGLVVSADPDADTPRFPRLSYGDLSPHATYVVGSGMKTDGLRVVELDSRREVTPALPSGDFRGTLLWVDDDSFIVYDEYDKSGRPDDVVRSTTCSIATGDCSKPSRVADGRIRLPIGYDAYGS